MPGLRGRMSHWAGEGLHGKIHIPPVPAHGGVLSDHQSKRPVVLQDLGERIPLHGGGDESLVGHQLWCHAGGCVYTSSHVGRPCLEPRRDEVTVVATTLSPS